MGSSQCGGKYLMKKRKHSIKKKSTKLCKEMFTKKYQSRKSPAYPATPCANMILPGKDGRYYKSMPAAGGKFYQWRPLV
jgi:hypothetical protein